MRLQEDRFGFEPEVTVKIAKRGLRVYEVGISYSGRTYEEGKKIGWKDGVRAIWCLIHRLRAKARACPVETFPYGIFPGYERYQSGPGVTEFLRAAA
jgi:hypothetical protein